MRLLVPALCLLALAGCGAPSAAAVPAAEPAHPSLPALGVDTHLEGLSRAERRTEFARLADLGSTWVRLGAPWYALQPSSAATDRAALGELDEVVADATEAGLRVLLIGDQAPDWAGGGDATASNPAAYGAFMGQLAEHFRGRGPHGTSPAYELMNEPDGLQDDGRTWATPTDYAHSACAAFHAIKARDPSAAVAAGSLDVTDWQSWLRSSFDAGLRGCFDVLSAHPYGELSVLTEIRAAARAAGAGDVPVWVTEFGYSTCDAPGHSCVAPPEQSAELVARLRELRRDYPWVPVAIVYEAHDEPANAGKAPERAFGLFTRDGTELVPKPAVAALRALYRGA